MSVSIEKLITFQDYSVKYDINSKGIKPSAYYDTLKWTFDNYDKLTLKDRTEVDLLCNLEYYTTLKLLPQDLVDILSREDAIKIMELNDAINKILKEKYNVVSINKNLNTKEQTQDNEQKYDTQIVDFPEQGNEEETYEIEGNVVKR